MKKREKVIEVLNDLIRVNNDRIEGYEKEAHEERNTDPDIKSAFYQMATESRSFVNELHAEVLKLGGAPVSKTTISGKVYLFWLDLRANFTAGYTGSDVYAILSACEAGEEAVQQVYSEAL
ncbi:MAG: PA2169 family four-helix-bundle protein, partial [Bacteroidota bacterium]|nr:PA2169 family four-helix-bundle protein [Bacteroidota bacterium]